MAQTLQIRCIGISRSFIWNNEEGDTAYLYNAQGKLVSTKAITAQKSTSTTAGSNPENLAESEQTDSEQASSQQTYSGLINPEKLADSKQTYSGQVNSEQTESEQVSSQQAKPEEVKPEEVKSEEVQNSEEVKLRRNQP